MPYVRSFRPALRRSRLLAGTALLALGGALLAPLTSQAADVLPGPSVPPGALVVLRGITSTDPRLDPPAVRDAVAVTATSNMNAENTALALRADGTVVGWGADSYGQATPPADLADVVGVDLGGGFGLALRSDGTVAAWGSNATGALDVPAGLGPVTAVSAGGTASPSSACGYALALRPDGTVVRWGGARAEICPTFDARFNPPAGLSGVVAISAGSNAAMALRADGTVVAWGPAASPSSTGIALARWHDITAVSTDAGKFIGLQADQGVVTWGFVSQVPMVPIPSDIVSVSAGETATFLSADGSLHERGRQSRDTGSAYVAAAGGFDFTVEVAGPSDEPTPEPTPTVDPTPEPTVDPTPDPTDADPTPTVDPSPEPTPTVDPSPEPTPTVDPTPEPTPTVDPSTGGETEVPALGSATVHDELDANRSGVAEAFQYTASRDLTASRLQVYLDRSSTARTVLVGVYADRNGSPGRLLASGRVGDPVAGRWNSATTGPVDLQQGRRYWLALGAPNGAGTVRFRDVLDGKGGPAQTSAGRGLGTTLPDRWRTVRSFANAPASLYLE